jgi:undecaprenyl-diphosphatase
LLFAGWIASNLRDPIVVVVTLSGYGVLLAIVDRLGRRQREISDIGIRDAVVIGIAQALALVPGTSRSGVTITAAMALGLKRQDAARFSFLLSAPVILLATLYEAASIVIKGASVTFGTLAVAALISGLVAYLTIGFFMRFINAIGLLPFAIYRLVLAAVILMVVT